MSDYACTICAEFTPEDELNSNGECAKCESHSQWLERYIAAAIREETSNMPHIARGNRS